MSATRIANTVRPSGIVLVAPVDGGVRAGVGDAGATIAADGVLAVAVTAGVLRRPPVAGYCGAGASGTAIDIDLGLVGRCGMEVGAVVAAKTAW